MKNPTFAWYTPTYSKPHQPNSLISPLWYTTVSLLISEVMGKAKMASRKDKGESDLGVKATKD